VCLALLLYIGSSFSRTVEAQSHDDLSALTQPVNDFAGVIDPDNAAAMDRIIRRLKAATGDVVVVATVRTIEPYGDIREYANRLFENHGKGIGDKDKDNAVLIVLALKERRVQIEVGYGLEMWITDGFAGETSRLHMAPEFTQGRFGDGLRIGVERIVGRIAQGRNITLEGVRVPQERRASNGGWLPFLIVMFMIFLAVGRIGRRRHGIQSWGRRGWSGWSSGVGPFGGGWSGGGGGFGGGFGGFGGGGSGGGGGGSSW
jgi:uncharacterized protein